MAVTNWQGVGSGIHKGDMERGELALRRQAMAQSAQAQQFNQERQIVMDAEARKQAAHQRAMDERKAAIDRDTVDLARREYDSKLEERDYNRQRDERAFQLGRDDIAYNRNLQEREYQTKVSDKAYERNRQAREDAINDSQRDFEDMVKRTNFERMRNLMLQENEEYDRMRREREQADMNYLASTAALFSNIARNAPDSRGFRWSTQEQIDFYNAKNKTNFYRVGFSSKTGPDGYPITLFTTKDDPGRVRFMPSNDVAAMFMMAQSPNDVVGGINRGNADQQWMGFLGASTPQQQDIMSQFKAMKEKLKQYEKQDPSGMTIPVQGVPEQQPVYTEFLPVSGSPLTDLSKFYDQNGNGY